MDSARHRLYMFGLPIVESVADLASGTHLSRGLLYRLSKFSSHFYKRFQIPKGTGPGVREIRCPAAELKAVQAWILRNVLDRVTVHPSATGFRQGHGIKANVDPHRQNRYFACLDIEDFFPSINYGKIWTVFRTLGYNAHISHVFASLCTCDGVLPQGGVASPALSNIVCMRLDRRLAGYCGKRNVAYTRYADDLTFSAMSPRTLVPIRRMAERILHDEDFALNHRKTRIMGPRQRRKVTGLVISDDGGTGVGRKQKRILRAKIFNALNPTNDLSDDERNRLKRHIDGWLAFLADVDATGGEQLRQFQGAMFDRWYGDSIDLYRELEEY